MLESFFVAFIRSCSSNTSAPSKSKTPIDRNIINQLKDVLDQSSDLVQTFRRAREAYTEDSEQNIRIKLIAKRGKDGRQYDLPTANEVAGLIVGDLDACAEDRDIVLQKRDGNTLQRINIFHPMYLALQYPLLMPCAQDGYTLGIPQVKRPGKPKNKPKPGEKDKNEKTVTMREWFAYQIQDRPNQHNLFVRGGRLFQQFLVDGFTMVETERLYFHRSNQSKLRCDTYSNIRQSIASGNTDPTQLGKPVILPSSYTGGPRYMQQNYMDAMALCRWYGCPDLFLTITCNPKWPEIARYMREHNLQSTDRPDILSRVFKMKLDQLIKDVKELHLFGRIQAGTIFMLHVV